MGVGALEPSDEVLVSRTVRGDSAAFGALYDRLAPCVQRFLRGQRLDLDHHGIEDAVQETFVRVHGLLVQFDKGRALRPFVLGVARRVALETERRLRSSPRAELDLEPSRDADVAAHLLTAERDAGIARSLSALSAEERTVVVFRFVNELTMQELADALSCSIPTARARLRDAMARFNDELLRAGIAPEDGR